MLGEGVTGSCLSTSVGLPPILASPSVQAGSKGEEQKEGGEGKLAFCPSGPPPTLQRSPPRSRRPCPHLEQIRSIQSGPALGGHTEPAHPRGPSHSLTTCRSDSPHDARPCSVLASRWPLDLFSMKADRFRTYIPALSGLSLQPAMISPEACLFICLFIYPGR